jgi:hypothetical protein
LKLSVDFLMTSSTEVGLVRSYFSHSELKVFVGVGLGVGVGVGVAVAVGLGVGVALGAGVGFGAATFTPSFHTSFLPLLTQVYLMLATVEVAPIFGHAAPALTAAALDA